MVTGYLTVNNLIDLKLMSDRAQLDTARFTDLIQSDLASPLKKRMREGVNYYNAQHDILEHRSFYFVDGVPQEDRIRANNKLPHPFHKILVDQKASYIAGSPVVVSVVEGENSKKFQESITTQLGLDFDELLTNWIVGASNKALEWIHFYIDPKGNLQYTIVPAEQIIPVYDSQYEKELIYVIRFYVYDLINEKSETSKRYKVEWWTKDRTEYWAQQEDGMFVHDPDAEINPSFHWYNWNTSKPSEKLGNSWGRIPFIALWNNPALHTDLQDIKPLIDAYDLVKSGWMNDIEDFVNAIYVLKGFQGLSGEAQAGLSQLAIFMKNLKQDRAVAVKADGAVSTIQAQVPVEATEKFLNITRKEIFYFGEGVDAAQETIGNSPSGIALKFLYAALDLKSNRLIRGLKKAMKDFMWFVTEYINRRDGTKFDHNQIVFVMNKSMIFNEKEKIDGLLVSQNILSLQTILENHPYVDNVERELDRIEKGGTAGQFAKPKDELKPENMTDAQKSGEKKAVEPKV